MTTALGKLMEDLKLEEFSHLDLDQPPPIYKEMQKYDKDWVILDTKTEKINGPGTELLTTCYCPIRCDILE